MPRGNLPELLATAKGHPRRMALVIVAESCIERDRAVFLAWESLARGFCADRQEMLAVSERFLDDARRGVHWDDIQARVDLLMPWELRIVDWCEGHVAELFEKHKAEISFYADGEIESKPTSHQDVADLLPDEEEIWMPLAQDIAELWDETLAAVLDDSKGLPTFYADHTHYAFPGHPKVHYANALTKA